MKYLRILMLAAVTMGSLMSFTATASATWLTSPTGTTYTGLITGVSHGFELHGVFTTVKCSKAHIEGHVVSHSTEFGVPVQIQLTTHSFSECNFPVKILKPGILLIHSKAPYHEAEHTGTVTSSGTEMTIQTSIANCIFTTSSTDFGTLTGTDDTRGHATISFESAGLPRTGHSIFCGSAGTLTGGYTITTPSTLWVDDHTF